MRTHRAWPAPRSPRRQVDPAKPVHLTVVVLDLEVVVTVIDVRTDSELSGHFPSVTGFSFAVPVVHHCAGAHGPSRTVSAPGNPAKRLSKLRFSCSRIMTCLILCVGAGVGPIGVVLVLLQPATATAAASAMNARDLSHVYPPQIDTGQALCQCDFGSPQPAELRLYRRKIATIVAFPATKGALYTMRISTLYSLTLVTALTACSGATGSLPSGSVASGSGASTVRSLHPTAAQLGLWPSAGPAVSVCGAAPAGSARCLALVRTDINGVLRPATPAGYGPSDLQTAYNLTSYSSQ